MSTTIVREILTLIRTALTTDAKYKAWAEDVDNFGKMPLVFIGEDDTDPPGGSQYPLVCVCMINKAESGHKNAVGYEVGFYAAVKIRTTSKDNELSPKYIEYDGFAKVEELREQAELAIARSVSAQGWTFDGEGETIPDNKNGTFRSYSNVAISVHQGMLKAFYDKTS